MGVAPRAPHLGRDLAEPRSEPRYTDALKRDLPPIPGVTPISTTTTTPRTQTRTIRRSLPLRPPPGAPNVLGKERHISVPNGRIAEAHLRADAYVR